MVTFKKDKDKKNKIKQELGNVVALFSSGFIIATFLVLYLILAIVNGLVNASTDPSVPTSSETPSSSEPITSSSSISYINEEKIYNNLLDLAKEYEPNISKINTISYDESYLYIDAINDIDNNLHILYGELNSYTLEELLEALITSKDVFEFNYQYASYDLSSIVSTDITTLASFPKRDYNLKNKYLYYIDTESKVIGLSGLAYKSNSYISFSCYQYNIDTSSYDNGLTKEANNSNSEYYKVLSYLYNK